MNASAAALVLVNVQLELSQKEMASTLSMLIHVLTAALVLVHVLFQHLLLNNSIYKKNVFISDYEDVLFSFNVEY